MDHLTEIETFLARTGMAPSTLGRRALGDGHVIARLRQGANVTVRTVQRLQEFMRSYQAQASSTLANSEGQADVA